MSSAICFNLDQSKILSSGNGLNLNAIGLLWTVYSIDKDQTVQNIQFDVWSNGACSV